MNQDNVAIRLKGFIEEMGLTNSQFADRCGIPRPSLSQLLSGRNKKISDEFVGKIHTAFPELSIMWLMFGEGEMLVSSSMSSSASHETSGFSGEDNNFTVGRQGGDIFSNLTALNEAKIDPNLGDINAIRMGNKTAKLESEIEKLRKNPRKVTHITVYYDDSTFETFRPEK